MRTLDGFDILGYSPKCGGAVCLGKVVGIVDGKPQTHVQWWGKHGAGNPCFPPGQEGRRNK